MSNETATELKPVSTPAADDINRTITSSAKSGVQTMSPSPACGREEDNHRAEKIMLR